MRGGGGGADDDGLGVGGEAAWSGWCSADRGVEADVGCGAQNATA